MNIQSLVHSRWSPHNVPFIFAARMTMNPCLFHSQLVQTTSIDQYSPSRSHFASAGGDCIHSSLLVEYNQGG